MTSPSGSLSTKAFAELLVTVQRVHQQSWNGNRHTISLSQAADRNAGPWAVVVYCTLAHGYVDIWDWCEVQGVDTSSLDGK